MILPFFDMRKHINIDFECQSILTKKGIAALRAAILANIKVTGYLRHSPDFGPFTPAYAGHAGMIDLFPTDCRLAPD